MSTEVNLHEGGDVPRRFLPSFPSGFEDETVSSRVGVYHILSGHSTTRETYRELFHVGPFPLTYLIPPHLDKLANQLPGDPQERLKCLYQESTLQPLFQMYFHDRAGQQFESLCRPRGTGTMPRWIVGESGNTRLCVECLAEDASRYGIPYIHRSHQIPATTTCWKHETRLIDCCPVCRCPIEVYQDITLVPWRGCVCGQDLTEASVRRRNSRPTGFEIAFARFGKDLLEVAPSINISTRALTALYQQRLSDLGFRRGSHIDRVRLRAALKEHIGDEILPNIDRAYRNGRSPEWEHTLMHYSAAEAPLPRHLIMSHFLFREANLFVAQVKTASPDASIIGGRKRAAIRRNVVQKLSEEELCTQAMTNLTALGRKDGLTVDQLWKLKSGTMKRLVRWNPKAVQVIEARLARSNRKARPDKATQPKRSPIDNAADANWTIAIEEAAKRLYGSSDKPRRITMNKLVIEADIRVWPTAESFPRTRATCEALSESAWHFYARRLLWTMHRIPIDSTGKTAISFAAGINAWKASDVIQYLIDMGYRPTSEHPMVQLERLEIQKHWAGPYPDREYRPCGRAYVPKGRPKRNPGGSGKA